MKYILLIILSLALPSCYGSEMQIRRNEGQLEFCIYGHVCNRDDVYWTSCSLAPFDSDEEKACKDRERKLEIEEMEGL